MNRDDLVRIAEQAVMDALGVPDRGGNRQRAHGVAVLVVDRLQVVETREWIQTARDACDVLDLRRDAVWGSLLAHADALLELDA